MKKIRINENELIDLIEKLVKENLGFGNGQNLGVMGGTPISKYKDLLEKEDIEEDDITDNEEGVSEATLHLDLDDETQDGLNQEDYMESIKEQIKKDGEWGFGLSELIDKVTKAITAMVDTNSALTPTELATLSWIVGLGQPALTVLGVSTATFKLWKSIEKGTYKSKKGITESQLVKRLQGKLITEKKKKKGKKDKTWIQKAYKSGDVKKDKLTDYCDGKVTCKCVEKALKNKGMKKGAQMYLNMNKSKCKSLRD